MPNPKQGVALSIGYQARHPILNTTGDNILNQNLDIPFVLEGSLQSYVAYKVFSHMNGQENAIKSQEHLSMFAAINSDVEMRDLINSSFATSHNKLEDRGFI